MQIFDDPLKITKDKNTVLTLGTFDGIHLGHKKIIERVNKDAAEFNGRSFLVTFYPHPRSVISKDFELRLLTTQKEKISLLESLCVENLLIINFTKEFSQQTAEEFFLNYIINKIGLKEIIVGYDHHFGKGRGGDVLTLKEMGTEHNFNVVQINAFDVNGESISSSKIRKALNEGDVQKAALYLGRYYSFNGLIIEGDKRGRELGFPTANIQMENPDKLLPEIGIYVVKVNVKNGEHFGLLSIGKRPTFYNSGKIVPEVYLYDFDKNIYNEEIKVELIERLRGEEKFSSAEELVKQMNKDKENGLKILSKINN